MKDRPDWINETPTKGRFRLRARNEMFFAGSDKPNERGGMYAFWTALIDDPRPHSKHPHSIDVCPGRARINLHKTERFTRMPLDALKHPESRNYYRQLHRSLKKPLKVRRSTFNEIVWWMQRHPEIA